LNLLMFRLIKLKPRVLSLGGVNRKFFSSGEGVTYYTESHEWLQKSSVDTIRVGITDHAQSALGDISFVVLPRVGKKYQKDQECAVIESTKAVGEIKMPITGTISEINKLLDEDAKLINDDPEGKGWFFTFKIDGSNINEDNDFFKKLMTRERYLEYLKK
jgi:glycine cleavage system H protein